MSAACGSPSRSLDLPWHGYQGLERAVDATVRHRKAEKPFTRVGNCQISTRNSPRLAATSIRWYPKSAIRG